jgi:hypothetical protein
MKSKYDKVVKKLVVEMMREGYICTRISDGEEWHPIGNGSGLDKAYLSNATSTDESVLIFNSKDGNGTISLFLILGNSLYETVSDYGWKRDIDQEVADRVTDKVSDYFEQKYREYA